MTGVSYSANIYFSFQKMWAFSQNWVSTSCSKHQKKKICQCLIMFSEFFLWWDVESKLRRNYILLNFQDGREKRLKLKDKQKERKAFLILVCNHYTLRIQVRLLLSVCDVWSLPTSLPVLLQLCFESGIEERLNRIGKRTGLSLRNFGGSYILW